ncbi:hypothetical protein GWK91_13005 [Virgibacillus sp. MSP4-1]|uniref:hypothetical protein n=1 Tax=Virgibacillus sp. MSP4-1 TaxID=2700081 RepID=UPI0003A8C7D0|nr:hypothetical protein [Virgibacillus sp. MSP4-1]QHS23808.1 hypothetical protein GWK91_13005 [Virgibacillus sp. MSP4-1]
MSQLKNYLIKLIISLLLVFGIHKIASLDLPLLFEFPFVGVYIQYLFDFLFNGILLVIAVVLFLKVAYQCAKELWSN